MSIALLAVINFVLAALLLTAILRLHVWAILTGHHDQVPATAPAPVVVLEAERGEQPAEDGTLALV